MGSDSLDKGYEPSGIEEKWYQFWLDNGFFKAEDKSDKKSFSIVISLKTVMQVSVSKSLMNIVNSLPTPMWLQVGVILTRLLCRKIPDIN